jgi:EmrB/QacA subfamily drug resistance transporter
MRSAPRAVLPLATGAAFLSMLDTTVVNLALPDMAGDFAGRSVADLSWVISLYAISFAALLAPAGRLADVIGRRRLFAIGVGIFTVMSLACALAPDLPMLLVARAVQGAGAAAMIPASLAVLIMDLPAERRAAAIGLWGAASAFAAAIGPSVGGVLVDAFGWPSLFLINLPLGLAILAFTRAIPAARGVGGRLPDVLGTVLLGAGVGALVLGITQGQEWGWTDPRILGVLIGGVVAVGAAIARSARHPVPAIEISLWRSRTFAAANLASTLYGAALFPWLLVGVYYLTQTWHYSELKAGLALSPGAVAAAATALLAGRHARRYGPRTAIVVGSLLITIAGVWVAGTLPDEPHFLTFWLPAGTVVGVGMGAVTWGTASAAALSVSPLRFAGATGLNTTGRQVGGALGIAVLALLLQRSPGAFADVYTYCTVIAVGAMLVGFAVSLRPAPTAPSTSSAASASVAASASAAAAAASGGARPAPATTPVTEEGAAT